MFDPLIQKAPQDPRFKGVNFSGVEYIDNNVTFDLYTDNE